MKFQVLVSKKLHQSTALKSVQNPKHKKVKTQKWQKKVQKYQLKIAQTSPNNHHKKLKGQNIRLKVTSHLYMIQSKIDESNHFFEN